MILQIIIAIGVAIAFVEYSKTNNLNPWFWGIIAVIIYLAAQFITGIIIGLYAPTHKFGLGTLIGISFGSGFLGIGLAFLLMLLRSNKIKAKIVDAKILDENISDNLDSLLEE